MKTRATLRRSRRTISRTPERINDHTEPLGRAMTVQIIPVLHWLIFGWDKPLRTEEKPESP